MAKRRAAISAYRCYKRYKLTRENRHGLIQFQITASDMLDRP